MKKIYFKIFSINSIILTRKNGAKVAKKPQQMVPFKHFGTFVENKFFLEARSFLQKITGSTGGTTTYQKYIEFTRMYGSDYFKGSHQDNLATT